MTIQGMSPAPVGAPVSAATAEHILALLGYGPDDEVVSIHIDSREIVIEQLALKEGAAITSSDRLLTRFVVHPVAYP